MSIEIKQKTVDIVFAVEKGQLRGNVAKKQQTYQANTQALRLHFSLMGETVPKLSPLSADFSMDDKTTFCRYDWIVGATLFNPCYEWDWFNKIAENRAVVVQLLIDPGESGCVASESNAFLMGLLPSKDTASFLETHVHKLGDSLDKLSNIAGVFNGIASGILKTSAVISNFVVSDENGHKNWFIYRFLDEKRLCCAVEWNIHRTVLHQYGSLLRGSILLAFHGNPKPEKPLKLLLRPRLNFGDVKVAMNYDPPEEQLEKENPVELAIMPSATQA